jgi:hypothetical protein
MEEGGRAVTVPPGRSVEIVGEDFSFDPKTVLVEGGKRVGESAWRYGSGIKAPSRTT